jgi:hypothetical protein
LIELIVCNSISGSSYFTGCTCHRFYFLIFICTWIQSTMWATTFHIDEGHFKNLYKCTYHDKCTYVFTRSVNSIWGKVYEYSNTNRKVWQLISSQSMPKCWTEFKERPNFSSHQQQASVKAYNFKIVVNSFYLLARTKRQHLEERGSLMMLTKKPHWHIYEQCWLRNNTE